MSKVFIINDLTHDFSKAARYGEFKFVTTGKVPIFKTDVAKAMLKDGLSTFNREEDYLLVTGAPLLCMMAILEVYSPGHLTRTLVFDAKQQDYTVRHI